MKKIPLSQGKFSLVDDRDHEDLLRYKWSAHRNGNTFYAVRHIRIGKKRLMEWIHRRILGLKPGDGKYVDHINNNGLDNRRNNLRVCTNKENLRNRTIKQSNNTSGFRGVYWNKRKRKWEASIGINSQRKHLGYYESKTDAAMAYNRAAIKYFGKFAKLNHITRYLRRNRGQEELGL